MNRILLIQTAYLGDVILATPLIEKLNAHYPDARLDVLVRKGNEGLLLNHPKLNKVLTLDKKESKLKTLFKLTKEIRQYKYDAVINLHRFASSGFIAAFSKAELIIGFDKNPFSFAYDEVIKHKVEAGIHEVARNLSLITDLTDESFQKPVLYPSETDFKKTLAYVSEPFVTMAPASVWYTKQLPENKWVELIEATPKNIKIYLIGGKADTKLAEQIFAKSQHPKLENLCGKFNLLESAALMSQASMNYVNDSGPMHLASAMNAPVTVFYCSTVTDFGFYPLSDQSYIKEINYPLSCRPCGLHGYKSCPKGHYKCGNEIKITL